MSEDAIIRSYSRLAALKQNIPSDNAIDVVETYIKEYHDILENLSKEIGAPLDEFRVPDKEINHRLTSFSPFEDKSTYSDEKYCEKGLFLSKLDGVLSYFTIKYLSKEKKNIGFKPPE